MKRPEPQSTYVRVSKAPNGRITYEADFNNTVDEINEIVSAFVGGGSTVKASNEVLLYDPSANEGGPHSEASLRTLIWNTVLWHIATRNEQATITFTIEHFGDEEYILHMDAEDNGSRESNLTIGHRTWDEMLNELTNIFFRYSETLRYAGVEDTFSTGDTEEERKANFRKSVEDEWQKMQADPAYADGEDPTPHSIAVRFITGEGLDLAYSINAFRTVIRPR